MSNFKKILNKYTGRHQLAVDPTILSTFRDIMMDNAMDIAKLDAVINLEMINGFKDAYEDESGIDTINSTNIIYTSLGDYYGPSGGFDSNTKFLTHADTDPAIDAVGLATITLNSPSELNTSNPKFGVGNIRIPNVSTNTVTIASSVNFAFAGSTGSEPCTMDFWFKTSAINEDYANIFNVPNWSLQLHQNTLHVSYDTSIGWQQKYSDGVVNIAINTWYHIEVGFNGTDKLYFFVNGNLIGSPTAITQTPTSKTHNTLTLGGIQTGVATIDLDEIRFSRVLRHATGFTAPALPYTAAMDNMIMISEKFSIDSVPATARMLYKIEEVDSINLDTDLMFDLSRDDDTTRIQGTPELVRIIGSNKLIGVDFDLSTKGSGTDLVYRVRTANNKDLYVKAVACQIKT